jgi:APA family basic amino acid/polyamine antiporter
VAGYPFVPALYMVGAAVVLVMLFVYRPATTWPGLAIMIAGAGVYAVLPLRHGGGTPPIGLR